MDHLPHDGGGNHFETYFSVYQTTRRNNLIVVAMRTWISTVQNYFRSTVDRVSITTMMLAMKIFFKRRLPDFEPPARRLMASKSVSPDRIPCFIIKACSEVLTSRPKYMFNLIWGLRFLLWWSYRWWLLDYQKGFTLFMERKKVI